MQTLVAELKKWSAQVEALSAKQEKTAIEAKKCAEELDGLRAKLRETSERLKESDDSGNDVWENIGDGG
ncbi:MAG: sll1863 family stress response protein [Methylococcaceae bacterium]